jgi:hypothetical protein
MEIKQQGNTHFTEGKYEEAIQCYLEGIAACPKEETDKISMFNQNIAAAYDKMVGVCSMLVSVIGLL